MKTTEHLISEVLPGSIGEELEIEPGDVVISVNGQVPEDIFDYDFLCEEEEIELLIRKANGEEYLFEIEKDEDEDLGLRFENGLMDSYRSCHNKCIFCFIDQMPPGMRDTLYFKDDDARLSFLQGNYITLTNLRDKDVERLIRFRMEPINISVHTMNPELRCKMLNNRFAGAALDKLRLFYEAGLEMNGQIVMCPGYNDREELDYTIGKLYELLPFMRSLSVVPVGLTKYRDGLAALEPVSPALASDTIERVERWQEKAFAEYGVHFVHASDELYLSAGLAIPEAERYDGYPQLANGVGSIRSLTDEFEEALSDALESEATVDMDTLTATDASAGVDSRQKKESLAEESRITVATGVLAAPVIRDLAAKCMAAFPHIHIDVVAIRNHFFGEMITVSGLVTGQDLIEQLQDRSLGERLLIPDTMLRSGEQVFLDDYETSTVAKTLQIELNIVESTGYALFDAFLGRAHTPENRFPGYEPEVIIDE